ncbi:MAG: hypothetical protein Q4A21_01495 [bacterium]|nr:hypothetical protein [bacterium]
MYKNFINLSKGDIHTLLIKIAETTFSIKKKRFSLEEVAGPLYEEYKDNIIDKSSFFKFVNLKMNILCEMGLIGRTRILFFHL